LYLGVVQLIPHINRSSDDKRYYIEEDERQDSHSTHPAFSSPVFSLNLSLGLDDDVGCWKEDDHSYAQTDVNVNQRCSEANPSVIDAATHGIANDLICGHQNNPQNQRIAASDESHNAVRPLRTRGVKEKGEKKKG